MRSSYHEELDGLLNSLLHMSELVETAIEESTAALFDADLNRAEAVISNDAELDQLHEKLEYDCLSLLALQAPVAGELRTVVSAIRMVFELARMGDLAAHIAKIARLRYPNKAVPASLEANFRTMSETAVKMIDTAREALANRDAKGAYGLAEIDTKMDDLRREHFNVLLDDSWSGGTAAAIDVALIGRYYERFGDHTVAVGRRIIYLITGEVPEGEDWPNA